MSRRHPHPHDGTPGPTAPTPSPAIIEHVTYCFLHPNGPGHQLANKVDELRAMVLRLMGGLAVLVLLTSLLLGPLVVKWLTMKVGRRDDTSAVSAMVPKATLPKVAEPTETWGFPAAEAQPMLDHRYLPGVPSRDATGVETKRRTTP
jgi:hypothetical protein